MTEGSSILGMHPGTALYKQYNAYSESFATFSTGLLVTPLTGTPESMSAYCDPV